MANASAFDNLYQRVDILQSTKYNNISINDTVSYKLYIYCIGFVCATGITGN